VVDDTGVACRVADEVSRVVSLVPSLTETVAVSAPGLLVGATDWCTHPADLHVTRVRGTKNPDVAAVLSLEPDLVLANAEENRSADLDRLRDNGIAVYVTDIRTLADAFASLERVLGACGVPRPAWLDDAETAWRHAGPVDPSRRLRAVVPVWRRPWMALGRDTFAGDVLARLGVDNVLAGSEERYPRFDPAAVPDLDLVVLPDEPYRFTADDGPDTFAGVPAALVDGRMLTWYGPSLADAATTLSAQLRTALG
jgi:ABC-type Fe3+-hydroxamate transport system substrate-binding protein